MQGKYYDVIQESTGHVSYSSHQMIRKIKRQKLVSSFYLQLLTGSYDIYLVRDYIGEHYTQQCQFCHNHNLLTVVMID